MAEEQKKAKLSLAYWGGRGLGEISRQMMTVSGTDFTDDRRPGPTAGDNVEANLGRLPVLSIPQPDGSVEYIGQSSAVNYYVAKHCGMMGTNDVEAAKIMMLCAHVADMKTAFTNVWPYGGETPEGDWQGKWFDSPEDTDDRSQRFLRWYLKRIEPLVGADGFAVGGKYSLADATMYNLLGESCPDLPDKLYHGATSDRHKTPFGSDFSRTEAVMKEVAPKMLAIVLKWRDNENLQTYLKNRGPQAF